MSGKAVVKRSVSLLVILSAAINAGCFSRLISPYSETAYQYATSLKVEALSVMDGAQEPYARHEAEAESLLMKMRKAFEYAKGRPKNEYSADQWKLMLDPNHHLLGGFLERWKREERLSGTFIEEAKGQVSAAFDEIIGLESGKEREKTATP